MMRRTRISFLALGVLAAAGLISKAAPAEQAVIDFAANRSGQTVFVMPSHDIECTFTPQGGTATYKPEAGSPELSCDRREPTYVRVILTPTFLRKFDISRNLGCCGTDNPFRYGSHWSKGPFTCESEPAGLSCKRADGRGFILSRDRVEMF